MRTVEGLGPKSQQSPKSGWRDLWQFLVLVTIIIFLGLLSFPHIKGDHPKSAIRTLYMNNIRQLGLAMMQYAMAHDNEYPTGKSSTEVFQRLMDDGYLSPNHVGEILYIQDMPGKVPYSGTGPLNPENVCYDVVAPVTVCTHDGLPLIISSGWDLVYMERANASERDPKLTRTPNLMNGDNPVMILYRKGGMVNLITRPDTNPVIPIGFRDNRANRQLRP